MEIAKATLVEARIVFDFTVEARQTVSNNLRIRFVERFSDTKSDKLIVSVGTENNEYLKMEQLMKIQEIAEKYGGPSGYEVLITENPFPKEGTLLELVPSNCRHFAAVCGKNGDYIDEEKHLKNALLLAFENEYMCTIRDVVEAFQSLGRYYTSMHDYATAKFCLDQAVEWVTNEEKSPGEPRWGKNWQSFVQDYFANGDYAVAKTIVNGIIAHYRRGSEKDEAQEKMIRRLEKWLLLIDRVNPEREARLSQLKRLTMHLWTVKDKLKARNDVKNSALLALGRDYTEIRDEDFVWQEIHELFSAKGQGDSFTQPF